MEYICKPSKVSIYINALKKTAKQIKAETGCDAIINGGLFMMSNFKPVCHLKADGVVLASDEYKYWGYGWNDGLPKLIQDYSKVSNYICCVCLVRNGKAEQLIYPADMGGARQRTAFGTFADGRVWMYASATPTTPEQLQTLALVAGVQDAIMMDGGGSTQGIFSNETVTSSRIVHNFICVWKENDMTEKEMREKVVSTAKKWLGYSESSGKHKTIIDLYNNHQPLAVGYKVMYTDAWCATYVSAVFIAAGLAEFAPTECSCPRMIELYKARKRWIENDAYVPSIGDIVMYDWQDSGTGDNTGVADHVGIVVSVSGNSMQIIEGNINNAVGYRTLAVNGKYIRGYCLPDYGNAITPEKTETKPTTQASGIVINPPALKKGDVGMWVGIAQAAFNARGYKCGSVDNDFGNKTYNAACDFQRAKRLAANGKIDNDTWAALFNQ